MVTFHREQRAIHDVIVGIVPEENLWSHDLFAVVG